MNKSEFEKFLKELCPWVTQQTFELLEKYKSVLQRENQKYNLTRLDSEDLVYGNYFLESLIPYIKTGLLDENDTKSLLDIGSGSGIPGIVLKILFPKLKVTVLDSNNKKTEFLNLLVEELQLTDVTVVYDRAENWAKNHHEEFDIVTSRAVSGLYKILELSSAFCKINGLIIQPKSLKAEEEFKEAQGTIKTLHLSLEDKVTFNFLEHKHHVFVFIKNKATPKQYPRSWQQIMKKPL
ncbi:16S rRNA (guanine(527)-N(7))-methyltransferase RsmG [Ureaplasma ceti]|uniref:Ribosomal RNA small subunit methyltransferase G n=1 Tax=Ureaplasma ceti TaxID=3119530 RepID=A0ABP9U9V4_9BACT